MKNPFSENPGLTITNRGWVKVERRKGLRSDAPPMFQKVHKSYRRKNRSTSHDFEKPEPEKRKKKIKQLMSPGNITGINFHQKKEATLGKQENPFPKANNSNLMSKKMKKKNKNQGPIGTNSAKNNRTKILHRFKKPQLPRSAIPR